MEHKECLPQKFLARNCDGHFPQNVPPTKTLGIYELRNSVRYFYEQSLFFSAVNCLNIQTKALAPIMHTSLSFKKCDSFNIPKHV
jgi:hypothetical protein